LQGATSSVQSVSQMLGPFLFTLTFAYFIGAKAPLQLPGAPFLAGIGAAGGGASDRDAHAAGGARTLGL